jgi:hypothetical protein
MGYGCFLLRIEPDHDMREREFRAPNCSRSRTGHPRSRRYTATP